MYATTDDATVLYESSGDHPEVKLRAFFAPTGQALGGWLEDDLRGFLDFLISRICAEAHHDGAAWLCGDPDCSCATVANCLLIERVADDDDDSLEWRRMMF